MLQLSGLWYTYHLHSSFPFLGNLTCGILTSLTKQKNKELQWRL